MCGIYGYFNNNPEQFNKVIQNLSKIENALNHRGPDQSNSIILKDKKILFGNNRLSIVDKNSNPQPYRENNLICVFNGEIYNYQELIKRENLSINKFKSHSDGEIILFLYKKYGIQFVSKLNGMFAIAIIDLNKNKIFLLRDTLGQKPIYYYNDKNIFCFSSELRSFEYMGVNVNFNNNESLQNYFLLGYIPAPNTMYENTHKIKAGEILELNIKNNHINKYKYTYDNLKDYDYDNQESNESNFRELLLKSIELRQIGDYKINYAMSGGLDSTSLAIISKEILNYDVETFTIRNDLNHLSKDENKKFNEDFYYADLISKKYNIKNTAIDINNDKILDNFIQSTISLEEPNYSFQNISQFIFFKEVSKYSRVMITGDGADELIGGYNFFFLDKYYKYYSYLPSILKIFFSKMHFNNKKMKNFFLKGLKSNDLFFRYMNWHSVYNHDNLPLIDENKIYTSNLVKENYIKKTSKIKTEDLLNIEFNLWLKEHYCLFVDKLSMAHSLELRFPFLDQELSNFLINMKISNKSSKSNRKYLLKNAFKDVLPKELINRRKLGLLPPASKWVRGKLNSRLNDNIFKLKKYDIFDHKQINTIIKNHVDKKEYNLAQVWAIFSISEILR